MKPALLDANLLIALLWPTHEHHQRAQAWFASDGRRRWATCPLTQLAFARIVSNPAFSPDALGPTEAIMLLERNLRHPRHLFWPDDVALDELADAARGTAGLQGHRQVIDLYLLALAARHGGAIATFDAGLRSLATARMKDAIEIVELR